MWIMIIKSRMEKINWIFALKIPILLIDENGLIHLSLQDFLLLYFGLLTIAISMSFSILSQARYRVFWCWMMTGLEFLNSLLLPGYCTLHENQRSLWIRNRANLIIINFLDRSEANLRSHNFYILGQIIPALF